MCPMARLRRRKSLVFLTVGFLLFAAFVPAAAAGVPAAILTALWLVLPGAVVTLIRRRASRCDEQPSSLLSVVGSRAPPALHAFA